MRWGGSWVWGMAAWIALAGCDEAPGAGDEGAVAAEPAVEEPAVEPPEAAEPAAVETPPEPAGTETARPGPPDPPSPPPPSVRAHSPRAREAFGPRGTSSPRVLPSAAPDHGELRLPPVE